MIGVKHLQQMNDQVYSNASASKASMSYTQMNSDSKMESHSKMNSDTKMNSNTKNYQSSLKQSNVSLKKSYINSTIRRSQPQGIEELLQVDEEIQHFIQPLKIIFERYASLGEPLNVQYLKGFKFNKVLLHANLLNSLISATESNIIYAKLTGQGFIQSVKSVKQKYDSNVHSPTLRNVHNLYYAQDQEFQNGKMNFHQFLKSIEFVAQKTYPEQENNLTHLIQTHFLQLEKEIKTDKQESILQLLVELLQDEQIIYLFSIMQDVFEVYYQYYVQSNKTMDQNQFMRFCKDFELSNCLISQARLMDVFYALASLNVVQQNYTSRATLFQKPVFIDKHQFVEAISLVGVMIYQHEESKLSRIIFLLEKMNDSQGALNAKKSFGLTRSPQGHHWDLVKTIYKFFHSQQQEVYQKQSYDQILSQGLQKQ